MNRINHITPSIPMNVAKRVRKIAVLTSKEWPGLYLTNKLVRSGLDVAGVITEREPLDGVRFNPRRWNEARHNVGLRQSAAALLGFRMGPAYAVASWRQPNESPTIRHIRSTGVAVHTVESFKSVECKNLLMEVAPDVTVICGTPILPDMILSVARDCTLNIHTSVLPHYRGGGSLFWPLFFDDPEKVGFTIHRAVAAVDAGPYLCQGQIPVLPNDTPPALLRRCFQAAVPRLIDILRHDPLGPSSWRQYAKPVGYALHAPTREIRQAVAPRRLTGSLKTGAKRLFRHLPLAPPARRGCGFVATFTFHRALSDETPADDWRRIIGHPTVSQLREKFLFLRRHFELISVSQCTQMLAERAPVDGRYAVITVDDGYEDFKANVLPLLGDLSVPASLFVCTGAVERGSVWYQQVYNLIDQVKADRLKVPWMDTSIFFGDVRHRVLTLEHVLLPYLKRLRRPCRQQRIGELLGSNSIGVNQIGETDRFCTVEELRRVGASRLVELHLHSHHHDPFNTLSDTELKDDLRACQQFFRTCLGRDSRVLSYPNGAFDDSTQLTLATLGLTNAFTTCRGVEKPELSQPLAIRRNGFGGESMADFAWNIRRLVRDGSRREAK